MRSTHSLVLATLAFILPLAPDALGAQGANPAHAHIGHLADAFRGTPEGKGLIPTAIAEANVVAQHAALAARDPNDLDAAKTHAGHIMHAIDPASAERGPGLGYGLKPAVTAALNHAGLAARSEGASQNVANHTGHITASLTNTSQRADRIAELAKGIQAAASAADAAPLVTELNTVASQLVPGVDANGDGRVGWQENEGGLQQAEQHVGLLKTAEGITE
ncbi:MAG: hypothetical protein ACREL7_10050 [Longimicrobiales bacterium]